MKSYTMPFRVVKPRALKVGETMVITVRFAKGSLKMRVTQGRRGYSTVKELARTVSR